MTALPAWIDRDAWNGYVDMRKAIKKPMTPRAELVVLKTLFQMRAAGHDPNEALDQSSVHNWIDVYVPKPKEIPNIKHEPAPREAPRTPEEIAAADAARRRVMEAIRPVVKLVRAA